MVFAFTLDKLGLHVVPPYSFNVRKETGHDSATSSVSPIAGFTAHTLSDSLTVDLLFFHSGERIQKHPDSLPSSPDACGQKAYLERKSSRFKNIRTHVDKSSDL